jgi:hypothetical protein
MLFAAHINRCHSLEFIEEESSDDGLAHKVTFRVIDLEAWNTHLVDILRFAEDEEDYLVSVRKEYFIDEGRPKFVWLMMIWGDAAQAAADLGSILLVQPKSKKRVPAPPREIVAPPPPEPLPQSGPRAIVDVRRFVSDEGQERVVKKVRLPHRRGNRDNPGETVTKKMGDKRLGAYVSSAQGAM